MTYEGSRKPGLAGLTDDLETAARDVLGPEDDEIDCALATVRKALEIRKDPKLWTAVTERHKANAAAVAQGEE